MMSEFHFSKETKNGFHTRCKLCTEKYYKKCTKCKLILANKEFYRHKTSKDNLQTWCKPCMGRGDLKTNQSYYEKHKQEMMDSNNKRTRKKIKENKGYKFYARLASRLSRGLKARNWQMTSNLGKALGCTYQELVDHLEAQFQPGMNWENYGRTKECWSIDHIYPISKAIDYNHLVKLCHYTNLQPLWVVENSKKNNKITSK